MYWSKPKVDFWLFKTFKKKWEKEENSQNQNVLFHQAIIGLFLDVASADRRACFGPLYTQFDIIGCGLANIVQFSNTIYIVCGSGAYQQ